MEKIGFLSFGHWRAAAGSRTRTAAESLLQTIELAQAAEDLGVDGGTSGSITSSGSCLTAAAAVGYRRDRYRQPDVGFFLWSLRLAAELDGLLRAVQSAM